MSDNDASGWIVALVIITGMVVLTWQKIEYFFAWLDK